MKEHPGEAHVIFKYARVLGILLSLHLFGDVSFEWREDQPRAIGEHILPARSLHSTIRLLESRI